MKSYTMIDEETGEFKEHVLFDELQDVTRKRKLANTMTTTEEFKKMQEQYLGSFTFFIFKNMDKLEKVLSDSDLVKFLYCASFIKTDNVLKLDNNHKYINKKMLQDLLKIGSKAFYKFYNNLIIHKLLIENKNKLYINVFLFWKGSKINYRKTAEEKLQNYIRIYIRTIRELYENTNIRQHKNIALIYKLIPYTNFHFNILCNNPNEMEEELIEPLKIKDIIKILGYNKTNITRFKHKLYSLKYNNYNIFMSVQANGDYTDSIIIINPLFFYRGTNINNLKYLISLFKIMKISNK